MLLYDIDLHFVSLSGHEVNKPSHPCIALAPDGAIQAEATHVDCSLAIALADGSTLLSDPEKVLSCAGSSHPCPLTQTLMPLF